MPGWLGLEEVVPEDHDENKLPRWAQERLNKARFCIRELREELERTREAQALLQDRRGWFTIPGPPPEAVNKDRIYRLYYLSSEGAHAACSLGVGDVLLVGRKVLSAPCDRELES